MNPAPTNQSEAFAVTAEGTADLTREQTRAARFVAPSRGVRYPLTTSDVRQARAAAALLGSRVGAVLCGTSAAMHFELPVPPWIGLAPLDSDAVIAVPSGGAHPDRRGVVGRRLVLRECDVTVHAGLATTTPARTWLDCAGVIPLEHLVAMGDVILRRQLATPEELADIVAWARRRRGVINARRALPLLDPAAESPGESLTRAHLLLGGVPRPVCNRDIYHWGIWIARVDLCWLEYRVIVEYDGAVHLEEGQRRRDAARRNQLQEAGWLVITFTADDMRQPWLMVAQVKRALASRTPR
jgi:hypothetical protein